MTVELLQVPGMRTQSLPHGPLHGMSKCVQCIQDIEVAFPQNE